MQFGHPLLDESGLQSCWVQLAEKISESTELRRCWTSLCSENCSYSYNCVLYQLYAAFYPDCAGINVFVLLYEKKDFGNKEADL